MKKNSGEFKTYESGWGVGEGKTRGKVLIKCDLDLYVLTLSRSSPTESRVRFPGTQNTN